MLELLHTRFGSHVYGTNVESSDTDIKSVFIPDARDILLQRAPGTLHTSTKSDERAKNAAGDVDSEAFSLHKYLALLMDGQTVALDMLFTPESHYFYQPHPVWRTIQRERARFLHKGTAAFVGYARQQAAKYGIKGTRIAAVRLVLNRLTYTPDDYRLEDAEIIECVPTWNNEFIKIVDVNGPRGVPEPHLEVCNRKIPLHAKVSYAKTVFQKIFDQYGHRARLAESNADVDWKALMHAVRVAYEAHELFTTGYITFPRPEAALLLRIRKGEMPYRDVATLIEEGLARLEGANATSTLRATPDREYADALVTEVYGNTVASYVNT